MIKKPAYDLDELNEAFEIAFILRTIEDSGIKEAQEDVLPINFTPD